jgi:hypothetical protein
MPRNKSKFLVTIEDGRGRTEVFRTNNMNEIDSLFSARICQATPDSMLANNRFFEIRREKFTFYCEKR